MHTASIQAPSANTGPIRRLRVTRKRIDANRRNAALSTGPRTPEGKAKVRLNALRHGFRARDETCIAAAGDEARREIDLHIEELTREIYPRSPEEKALVRQLALAFWKVGRAHVISARSRWWRVRAERDEQRKNLRFLAGMVRYEARANRELHRALDAVHDLERARIQQNERTKPLAPRPISSPAASVVGRLHPHLSGTRFADKDRNPRAGHPLPQLNAGTHVARLAR